MGYSSFSNQLQNSIESIKPLSAEKRLRIKIESLSWEELLPGESLETFSQRVNKQWEIPNLRLMIGMDKESSLKEKKYLKIKTVTTY